MRAHLPEDATLQMEPVLRGREHWSLIPTFAQRRMAAGLPISLLPMPDYEIASAAVQQLFRTADGREGWQIAHARGIRTFMSTVPIGPHIPAVSPSSRRPISSAYSRTGKWKFTRLVERARVETSATTYAIVGIPELVFVATSGEEMTA